MWAGDARAPVKRWTAKAQASLVSSLPVYCPTLWLGGGHAVRDSTGRPELCIWTLPGPHPACLFPSLT